MGSSIYRSRLVISAAAALWASPLLAADKINYQDHVLPIFRNSCLNCHNPDKKKAGLDLSTYSAALAGSNNGTVINSGDPDGSLLYKVVTHAEDPTMPPKKDKLPDKELSLIKAWIAAGALDTASGKPAVSAKPKIDLTVASSGLHKPDGPTPMPRDLLPEPVVRADRPWAVGCMASSPWAPVVAIGGQHQVLLYNTDTLELLGIVPFPDGEPQVVQFSRNGQILLIGGGIAGKSGKVSLWNVTTGQKLTDIGEEFDSVLAADISPDQAFVALGGPTKVFKVYSTRDGSLVHTTKKHTDWVTAAGYSPDGVLLASGDRAGGLWVWESKNGSEFYNLAGHKAGVSSVAFRDDSNFLASASEDGTVKLWDMTSGKEVKTWQAHGGGVLSVSFTHDGRLVTCGRDKTVKLWQADGTQIRQLDAFTDIALHAAFDSQGKRVIAGDWTGDLRVWDAAEGKLVGHLSSNPAPLVERLAIAEKRAVDLQSLCDKANADATAAQQAADRYVAEQKVTEDNAATAKKNVEVALAKAKSADDAVQSGKDGAKAAEAAVPEKQAAVDGAMKARDSAVAAREVAQKERKIVEDAVTEKQKASEAATQSANAAQSEAAAKSDDAQLASKAKEKKDAADKAFQELDAAKTALKTKADQIPAMIDSAAKAESELVKANESLAGAKKTLAEQLAAAEKIQAARAEAHAAIPKAQADATAADKAIAPKVAQVKAAQTQAAASKAAVGSAAQQVSTAKQEITRLKLGQVYVTVYNARQELLSGQAELDRLNASAQAGQTDVDTANAAIVAAKKAMADGPNQIKEQEAAVAKAKETLARANAELQAMQAALTQKQALLSDATELSKKLSVEAPKAPADATLNDAAAKARATVESLTANVQAAKGQAGAKAEEVKSATSLLSAAESTLAKTRSDLESTPKRIAALEGTVSTATAEAAKRKTAVEAATKAVAMIKAKVDQLNADYQKKSQESGLGAQAALSGKT